MSSSVQKRRLSAIRNAPVSKHNDREQPERYTTGPGRLRATLRGLRGLGMRHRRRFDSLRADTFLHKKGPRAGAVKFFPPFVPVGTQLRRRSWTEVPRP
jgi:hypothetical protein